MLDLAIDPKLAWALEHRDRFPVDVNRADREMLLRVPGLGVKSVDRIVASRRHRTLRLDDLGRLAASLKKMRPFVVAADHRPAALADRDDLRSLLRAAGGAAQPFRLMLDIALERPHDLAAFRDAARGLVAAGIAPRDVIWHEGGEDGLFSTPYLPDRRAARRCRRASSQLAEDVICHRDPERLALLYELLWRLAHGERELLQVAADPLVHRLAAHAEGGRAATSTRCTPSCASAASRRRTASASSPGSSRSIIILERVAPFFAGRFPRRCAGRS